MHEPKYVPSSVFIDKYGQRVISRGYTEIGGIRIEDDILVYDQYGQPVVSKGSVVIAPAEYLRHLERAMMLDPDPEYRTQAKAEYLKLTNQDVKGK